MLSLQNVTITIGAKTLLEEVSLDVRPGEVVALVGSNGAGKTTALKVLSGEWQPRSGQALLEGKPMTDWASQALATRRAIVSQSTTIPFEFLAAEVVLLGRTPHQTTRAHDIDVAERALHAAGVLHLAARRYTTLSGGEKQRVQIARALAQIEGADTASYLLLDEPTSALDIAHQQLALHLVREVATQNVGVLAILHDLNQAAYYADRIALLSDGRILACGPAHEVLTPALLQQAFDLSVEVLQHPCADCPLIIPVPAAQT